MNDPKARGVEDILIAVAVKLAESARTCGRRPEGLSGGDRGGLSAGRGSNLHRPSHRQFHGFRVVEDRKPVVAELRKISRAGTPRPAASPFRPSRTAHRAANRRRSAKIWRRRWEQIIPSSLCSGRAQNRLHHEGYRGLERKLRRAVRARGHFPSDEAATKLIFLVLRQIARNGQYRPANGPRRRPSSPSMFGDRFVRT